MTAFVLNGKHFKKKKKRGRKRKGCSLATFRRRVKALKSACGIKRRRSVRKGSKAWFARMMRGARKSEQKYASAPMFPNGRRRRRRSRNSSSTWIPAFRNGRRKRRNTSWVPAYAFNGALSGVKSAAFSNLKVSPALNGAAALGGFLGNTVLTNLVIGKLPLPAMFKGVIGRTAIGLVAAGVLGLGLRKVAGKYAASAALGATAGALAGPFAMALSKVRGGLKGLGDYLTPGDVARARSLGYLSVDNVASATPLGGLGCCNMGCDDGLSGTVEGTVDDELNVAG